MSWRKISCEEREQLVDSVGRSFNGPAEPYAPIGTITDLSGEFGEPYVMTRWGRRDSQTPLFEDRRWPGSTRECEHWAYEGDTE